MFILVKKLNNNSLLYLLPKSCLIVWTSKILLHKFQEANTAVKDFADCKTSSFRGQIEEIQNIIHKADETIKESHDVLSSTATKLKDEILKRDTEFEKFVSEDLQKDIPTGMLQVVSVFSKIK